MAPDDSPADAGLAAVVAHVVREGDSHVRVLGELLVQHRFDAVQRLLISRLRSSGRAAFTGRGNTPFARGSDRFGRHGIEISRLRHHDRRRLRHLRRGRLSKRGLAALSEMSW